MVSSTAHFDTSDDTGPVQSGIPALSPPIDPAVLNIIEIILRTLR